MTGRPTHTDQGRSPNHPAENPIATTAAVTAVVVTPVMAFVQWGLDTVSWPGSVETALFGAAVALTGVAAVVGGRWAQRWTTRVYYSPPPE